MGKGNGQAGAAPPNDVPVRDLWLSDPQKHDFPAAADYLDLLFERATVERLVDGLRRGTTVQKKAKDLMRAGELELLSSDNPHVRENIAKVMAGTRLSPVLLVRGPRLIVADGYHRICAAYHLTEDLVVPCRITGP